MKMLASCLALALALGGGASAAIPADTRIDAKPARQSRNLHADLPPLHMDPAFVQAMSEHMRAIMVRTPPALPASSIPVSNCNDSGAGSLRDAISNAATGDTIDLTNTGCSTITLTTGSIITAVDDLTLQGPGVFNLAISGNNTYAPLIHIGSGTLAISDLTVQDGRKYFTSAQNNAAKGGCIYSQGDVSLTNAEVKYCSAGNSGATYGVKGGGIYGRLGVTLSSSTVIDNTAASNGSYAFGGGIYTQGAFTQYKSLVSGNTATTTSGGYAQGGGVQVGSTLSGTTHAAGGSTLAKYSAIIDNVASSTGSISSGGGLYTTGNVIIENSTLASNQAAYGGGLYLGAGSNVTTAFLVTQSTLSGNSAKGGAGIFARADIDIYGSTITANTDTTATAKYGAGLDLISGTANLQSSIISGNTTVENSGSLPDDIYGGSSASVTGAKNLVYFSNVALPVDTSGADPMLHGLAYNGGLTATHATVPGSPAIDAGNNAAGAASDQRGAGFPRVIGANADIGAYEFNLDDLIFANGFD